MIKKNQIIVGIATRIIKEGISNDMFNNIINITNS